MATRRKKPRTPLNLLRARIKDFVGELPAALAGKIEGIHRLRVSGRRLRQLLPLAAEKPRGERVRRLRKRLRRVVRLAGASRDLDVGQQLLQTYKPRGTPEQEPYLALQRRLRALRKRSRERMAQALLDAELAQLRRDLLKFSRQPVVAATDLGRRARTLINAEHVAVLGALAELGQDYEPEALHALRRRLRRLRYLAETGAALRGVKSPAVKSLKAMQDALGAIHDAHMLAFWLARQSVAADRRGQREQAAVARRLQRRLDRAGRALHRAWLTADPNSRFADALLALDALWWRLQAPANTE